ncbi:MAG: alpha/beta fold hydrolase [Gammaproteobacteria bacterium]
MSRSGSAFRPPRPVEVVIPGPAGPLQGLVEDPGEPADEVAVLCHPHPLYHGTMNNKVVHALARAANRLRVPAVRFNFRGVADSGGAWDEGRGETDDALAVVEWAHQQWPDRRLWLGGFSFGSYVALNAAPTAEPAALVTVAPPVRRFPVEEVRTPTCPWLVIHGADDELVDASAVREWVARLAPAPRLEVVPETTHFFHGRLNVLQDTVRGFWEACRQEEPA